MMNRSIAMYCLRVVPAAAIVLVCGCGGSSGPPAPKKFKVTGTVQLDGAPVADGLIKILDVKGAGDAARVQNGSFSLEATPGDKRIEITASAPSDKGVEGKDGIKESIALIPAKYNTKSELKETVTEGANDFAFDLKSK